MPDKSHIPKFVGASVKRREDPALITGRGKYVADFQLDGMAYLAIMRSPYAHARILEIDIVEAENIEGVLAIFTGQDVKPHLARPMRVPLGMGPPFENAKKPERYPLASDKVCYAGEPVVAVVARDPYTAADALDRIFIDYDPLPVVVDPRSALEDEAALVHEDGDSNLAFHWRNNCGDVEDAFASAATIIELPLVNQRLIGSAMEPRAVLADYDSAREVITVWSTTQIPHGLRDNIAETLGLPEDDVRVIAPEVGGGFGVKAGFYPEEVLVPFIARSLDRPVKWVSSRSEDYLASSQGRGQISTVRLAADADGRILAVDLSTLYDCGAYYRISPIIPTITVDMITGVYDIPNVRAEITGVFTNKQAPEAYRGAGRPEAAYLIERAVDLLANELAIDPAEIRRRNFIPPERFPYVTATDLVYDSGDYGSALEKALEAIDYLNIRQEQVRRRQEGGKLLGIGLATYVEICGFGPWEAGGVVVDEEGQVTVVTGTSPHGQGHETTWAQIAADALQIPLEAITVLHGDTWVSPRGIGTFGSRSTPVGGSAVADNAGKVREKAKEIAAHLLEAAPADVILEGGRFHVIGVPQRALRWTEVAAAAYDDNLPQELEVGLASDDDFKPEGETFPFGAHACLVEIEPDTGEIELLRYVSVDDCGRVINPLLVEGQVHGGIVQGVGQALLEAARYDDIGNLISGTMMDYALPRAGDFPFFETHRTETPTHFNSLGAKGIGEAATIGATPAVVNAVMDALSHLKIHHLDMPLTAGKIWEALRREE